MAERRDARDGRQNDNHNNNAKRDKFQLNAVLMCDCVVINDIGFLTNCRTMNLNLKPLVSGSERD